MEKKTPALTYVMQLIIILLFLAILCFPVTLMALDGPDQNAAENEAATELVPLNLKNYISGTFHSAFESWFSHHYPLRSSIVTIFKDSLYRLEMSKPAIFVMDILTGRGETPSQPPQDNTPEPPSQTDPADPEVVDPMAIYTDPNNMYAQINLKRMNDTPVEPKGFKGSDAVYIGKSGYLYERGYIDEYYGFNGYANFNYAGLDETVRRLQYIQDELEDRYGIVMLYVLSSSKASQYADYIPDHYKNRYIIDENYVRPVDYLRPLLAASSINYLDSSEYYKEIGLLATFPKTGIHWNHLASFESTAELIRMYADISGANVKLLDTKGIIATKTVPVGGNSEQDVFNILYGQMGNVEGKIVDDEYYAPDVVVENPTAPAVKILLQGGSFTAEIAHYLRTYQVCDVRRIYYHGDGSHDPWGSDSPWTQGIMAWDDILEDLDMIIFESTESALNGNHCIGDDWAREYGAAGHNATYDSLYEFLKATE
jgi:hypothetical protein